uniref:Putative ovule protein n=1 Tax=Solanum chacoense TaxID=4108 RepID=A0A0V0HBL5_SOLCH
MSDFIKDPKNIDVLRAKILIMEVNSLISTPAKNVPRLKHDAQFPRLVVAIFSSLERIFSE